MKKLLFSIVLILNLFGYEVSFNDSFQKDVKMDKEVTTIETENTIENIPFKYIKVDNQYIIFGDKDAVDEWNRNSADLPTDAYVSIKKIGVINVEKWRMNILKKIENSYKECKIEKVKFLNSVNKIYLKPSVAKIDVNIVLECNNTK